MIDRVLAFFEKWLPVFAIVVFMMHYTMLKNYCDATISALKTYILLAIGVLFVINFIRSSKNEKLEWIKKKNIGIPSLLIVVLFFLIRFITLAKCGFDNDVFREIVFEGIFLVAFSSFTITKNTDYKLVILVFVNICVILNVLNLISYKMAIDISYSGELYSSFGEILIQFDPIVNKGVIYTNSNTGGVLSGLALLMSLLFIKKRNKKTYIYVITIWLINISSMYILFARSSFVAIIVSLLSIAALILIKRMNPVMLVNICLVSCVLVAIGIFVFIQINLRDGIMLSSNEDKINMVTSGRYQVWQDAAISHNGNYVLGMGSYENEIDERNAYLEKKHVEEAGNTTNFIPTILHLHSGYFGVFYYTGIIGFVLFFLILIDKIIAAKVLKPSYNGRKEAIIFASILIYLLMINLVEPYFIGKRHIEFLLMILIFSFNENEKI